VVEPWADSVCSVSAPLARQQGEFLNKDWLTVTNGFDVATEDIAVALHNSGRKTTDRQAKLPMKIVYTGKLYRGLRDPSDLLQTILRMENAGEIERSSVELDIYGGQLDGLAEMMPEGRYDHFVTLHGHVTREIALEAQRSADILLLLESPLPEAAGVLTGKIFEYIAAGVPILSLGSTKKSAIGQVLASTKAGLCAEASQEDVAATLRTILAGETPSWFAPDLQEIASYSRQAQAEKLLHHIKAYRNAKVSLRGEP
jgi:glycosyltransferase involved in cell wall biosynthesis